LLKRPSGYGNFSHDYKGAVGNLAQDVAFLWRRLNVPVIAAIHGKCFGGGLQIALGADFRFATPDSNLSIMEVKWGLIPDMSASITLRELVRIDVAKELTMTGRIISGDEAARLGLVTRCVADPFREAKNVAEEIIAR
jgi:enoyl-CoA hydratase/carnithine racemase